MNTLIIAIILSFAAGAATATLALSRKAPAAAIEAQAFSLTSPSAPEALKPCFEIIGGGYQCR